MKTEFHVAVCQMTSVDDVDTNYSQMKSLMEQVPASQAVDLFCFPENCLYMRLVEGERIPGLKLTDPVFTKLAELAAKKKASLHLGASPIEIEKHLYNSTILISPEGEISTPYQKIHLFDIQLQGQKAIRESDVFKHGSKPSVVEIAGWRIGQSICYDLRFAELFSHYARQECDLILIPAAFLPKTGEAHWEVLVRARAIESQAYVVASAQGGVHRKEGGVQKETYGHSLVVDPWGQVLTCLIEQPSIEVQTLTKSRIEQVRAQIPMRSHRRIP